MSDMNMMGGMPRPDNHEAAMARADLYKLANYSFKLFKMVKDGDELEGWVQAKITKAADYIASVYHFMEYEMKFSEYGEKLETSDVYSEQIKREFKRKLTEARVKLEKLREKNITDLNEGKDDERGGDDDTPSKFNVKTTSTGTRYTRKSSTFSDEPEKKVSKAAPTGAERRAEKSKDTSKEDSKNWQARFGKGSVTRHTPSDKEPTKKVKEGMAPMEPDGATATPPKGPDGKYPIITSGPDKGIRWGDKNPKTGKPAVGPTNPAMKEALKGGQKKLDVDKDGKLEKSDFAKLRSSKVKEERTEVKDKSGKVVSWKDEGEWKKTSDKKDGRGRVTNLSDKARRETEKSDKKVSEASSEKCNHTAKGKSCPVHGLKECSAMAEDSHQAKATMKHIKNPTAGEKQAAKDIKPGVKGYSDRVAMLKSAEQRGALKEPKSKK